MAMHDYHPGLPDYDERQILHDGCEECEHRGEDVENALARMDTSTFQRAWDRARQWNLGRDVGKISKAEARVLRVLYAVQIRLESIPDSTRAADL